MNTRSHTIRKLAGIPLLVVFMILQGGWFASAATAQTPPPTLQISDAPSLAVGGGSPNVLLVMDNSNSMDMAPNGGPSWSDDPGSRSWIARAAARQVIADYGSKMNIGLMAYQQDAVSQYWLMTGYKDISFKETDYPSVKNLRRPQPFTNNGTYFYYNQSDVTAFYLGMGVGTSLYQNQPYYWYWPGDTSLRYYVAQANQTNNVPTTAACWNNSNNILGVIAGVCTSWGTVDAGGGVPSGGVGRWAASIPLGRAWVSDATTGARYGFLHVPIAAASPGSAQAIQLNVKLQNQMFDYGSPSSDNNGWKDTTKPLENAGNTPMEGTLQTAKTYFGGGLNTSTNQTAVTCNKPDVGECGKNFVVFLTDGMPSLRPTGTSSTTADRNSGVITATANLLDDGIQTFYIGFGSDVAGTDTLNTFAQAGGTGAAYSAMSADELKGAMDSIFSNIMAQSSSYAAVATNSSYLGTDSAVYQGSYNPSNWSGDLVGIKLDPNTGEATTQLWSATAAMPAYGFRSIITYNPSTKQGAPFAWGSLDTSQQSALSATPSGVAALGGQRMLNYIAGATTDQGAGPNQYRNRPILGDIVNSAPVYVGKQSPQRPHPDGIESGAPYSDWVKSVSSRTPAVYVGANDGMLHAFDANTGKEIFAYIPSMVYGKLPLLASQDYQGLHKYFVDGSPSVVDAYIRTPQDGTRKWRTILVGGLNAGGQGIYALDVTNPLTVNANSVIWEFTDRETSADPAKQTIINYDRDLGYTFGEPWIAKTRAGWVAVFGNGYNNTANDGTDTYSTTGNAVLYVVDLETGILKKKLDTGRGYTDPSSGGKPNGLSAPITVDVNNDGMVDYVYAGDLQGNLWKFDLDNSDPAQWKIANSGVPLFTAKSALGQPQPITVRPEVNRHPSGGTMVYFGTGKLFETGDATLHTPVNTFYGIWDKGVAVLNGRNDLQKQEILLETGANGGYWRLVTNRPVDWDNQYGWYLDLAYPSTAPGVGERVIGNPVLDGERIVFVTITPTPGADECSAGGYSWLMELDTMTGGDLTVTPFDVNGDGLFDNGDHLYGPDDPFCPTCGGPGLKPPAGKREDGLISTPSIMKDDGNENKKRNIKHVNVGGTVRAIFESKSLADRRVSWRDISTQ